MGRRRPWSSSASAGSPDASPALAQPPTRFFTRSSIAAGSGQGGGVAEVGHIALGHLAQDAAHDFAGTSLGQGRRPLDGVRGGEWPDLGAHPFDELGAQRVAWRAVGLQGDIGVDTLALDVVRESDHRGLGHPLMAHQGALDLRRAQPMAGDIDDVVHPAGDPVVPVLVAPAAIAGEILAGVGGEIGRDEARVIAINSAHLPGPTIGDDEVAAGRAVEHAAIGIDELDLDTGKRAGRRAGLEGRRPRQGRDEDAAGLGLPPGVDDRAAALSDHMMVPQPGLWIDRFAHRAQRSRR